MQRVVLITGSNKGLGQNVGLELCRHGHTVVFTSRNIKNLNQTKKICKDEKLNGDFYQLDVGNLTSINNLHKAIKKKYRKIDTLINNAGILIDRSDKLISLQEKKMTQVFQTNVLGPLRMIQKFSDVLKKSSNGIIVNISSVLGQLTDMSSGMPSYRISKCALNAITKISSSELSSFGIKVNSVHPGWVKTDMGGSNASITIKEAIPGIVWAATLEKNGPTGKFFFNKKEISW